MRLTYDGHGAASVGLAGGSVSSGGSGSGDRGRVPFALVGVVLLLGSVVYANTLALRGPLLVDTAADDALDRAESAARPAVRVAAAAAAREAARHPVTVPADTPVGRALDLAEPFRDALRLRIALAAADALARSGATVGGVRASASLPPVESAADARAAIDRVTVTPLADGTAMRVAVRNVTLSARRDGSVVSTRRTSYTVAVATPVLAMHARTDAYEARLNRSPFEGSGLGRALTWRLWAVAQARGTGQYLGAPIENVLANRHVELSTNAAALRAQAATFGRADPAGRAGLVRATARVGAADLLAPASARAPVRTGHVLAAADGAARTDGSAPEQGGGDPLRVGVNATADRAFLRVLDGEGTPDIDGIAERAYRARATRRVAVTGVTRGERPPRRPPAGNWTFVGAAIHSESDVVARSARPTPDPGAVADERLTVAVRHRVRRRWVANGTVRTTTATWTDRYRVRIALDVRYAPDVGPDRPTAPVFVPGGALGGPNLAGVPAAARDEFLPPGAAERLAERAVESGGSVERRTLVGARPAELDGWIYRDLAALRERVRNLSVETSREAVAAGDANAPRALAAAVRERRAGLVAMPDRYDGAADRARVAARAAYVDAVIARLTARAGRADRRNGAYLDGVRGLRSGVAGRIDRLARIAADATAPAPRPAGRWYAGTVVLTPRGEPGYLPVTVVGADRVTSFDPGTARPLVARNTNLFAVPTGDAADAVADAALPARRTASLANAGRALVAADRAAAATDPTDPGFRDARADLRSAVASGVRVVDSRALAVLRARTGLAPYERASVIEAARERWSGPGPRALAAVDGSYAEAVAAVAARRADLDGPRRDALAVRLRVELADAATDGEVTVPPGIQAGVVDGTREARRELIRTAAERAAENVSDRGRASVAERLRERYGDHGMGAVLAGLPVAPVPGYWYATVNVWDVEVAGAYPRFAVTAPAGGPDGAGGRIRYVRDGGAVTLDVDGDGDPERLGRSERVAFRTWTVVVVVVPAGRSGVGDVDGNADERSPGWPCPSAGPPNGTAGGVDPWGGPDDCPAGSPE